MAYSDLENGVYKVSTKILKEVKLFQDFGVYKVSTKILKEVKLFDVYEGDKIEKNKKSYAISFLFQDKSNTLKDSEVDKEVLSIFNYLVSEYNVSLRDGKLKSE